MDSVSETMTLSPSSETANTFPGAFGNWDTGFVLPVAAGLKMMSPAELPRKMDFPVGAKSIELGELGSVELFPAALVFMAIGKISGWQPLIVPHWVVVT